MPAMDPPPSSPPAAPPRWARGFTIAASIVAAIALAVTLHQVGVGTVIDQLRTIGPWFAVLVALEVVGAMCDALAIRGFLGGPPRSPYRRVLHAQVAGRAINLVTPFAQLGEATKATLLMRDTPPTRAVAAVARFGLCYAAINLSVIVIGAPVCALVLPLPTWLARTLWIGAAVALTVGVGFALLVRAGVGTRVVAALTRVRLVSTARAERWRDRAADLDRAIRGDGDGWRGWAPGGFELCSKATQWVGAWIVMYANGQPPPLEVMAAIASAGTLITIVSNLVPLGLGVAEGGTAALLAALGQPPSLGVTMAMARRGVQLLYAAVGLSLAVQAELRPWRQR